MSSITIENRLADWCFIDKTITGNVEYKAGHVEAD
jgi:hypothetical protein